MDLTPTDDPEQRELEKDIKELVGGPLILAQNGFVDSDIYLAPSWLLSIHSHLRRAQGDTEHDKRPNRDQRELLVGVANRLELDVEQLLAAEPKAEVHTIRDALFALEGK